jgi:hypothetical protein
MVGNFFIQSFDSLFTKIKSCQIIIHSARRTSFSSGLEHYSHWIAGVLIGKKKYFNPKKGLI